MQFLLKMNLKSYRHFTQVFFTGQNHLFNDGAQHYLILQESSLFPSIKWCKNSNFCLIFKRSCLKQQQQQQKHTTFTPQNIKDFVV